jgi:hypothetical protein
MEISLENFKFVCKTTLLSSLIAQIYISVRVGDWALLKGENKHEIKIGHQNRLLKGNLIPDFPDPGFYIDCLDFDLRNGHVKGSLWSKESVKLSKKIASFLGFYFSTHNKET